MNKIVISHRLYKDGMDLLEGKAELIIPGNGDSDQIIEQLREADAYILRIGKIDRKAIEQCPNLKVITRPGVGYDSVDVEAATERGIPVVLCPSANHRAVAEHTLAMLMACSKNLVESATETKADNYNIRNKYAAVDVYGKTLVILGYGRIGKELARMCAGLDMRICVYDPYVDRHEVEALGYQYFSDIFAAIAEGDFISLHMPSTSSTRKMYSEAHFKAMKPTAFLLNAARGDIIDEPVLIKYLTEGLIAGAGLDVLVDDPMPADHPLMKLSNVILTPHMAAQTKETASKLATMAAEGTLKVLNGEKWPYVADPKVYEHPRWQGK